MMQSGEIRQKFFEFFRSKEHTIVPSAPIVIKDDPTLLFTNAGMNQFKEFFLGNRKPSAARVADTQKCLRVSGKHNDLEEVGVDTYHHTMFEMLGNWSFGNASNGVTPYFKEEAIAWSWELLTRIYHIPGENLYVTIFEGDTKEGLPKDDESYSIWRKCLSTAGFSEEEIKERIIWGNKKDNFWEMGDTGPCGPCTEIHADCRSNQEKKITPGSRLINKDHPQVIEIWNNVFIQYNRKGDHSLEPLPAKHVDTGMGFERLVRVLQNKQSNYETDIFTPVIEEIEKNTGVKYNAAATHSDIAFRVIADHIRAVTFPIADGQLLSNTGAGYVIRRILRRAVRYYFSYLDYKEPLLYKLLPVLANQFETVFPEIDKQQDFISKVIYEEEVAFLRTLDKGLKRVNEMLSASTGNMIKGGEAFELYDTYGFPLDLTQLIATERKFQVDEAGFEKEMLQQKTRSREASVVDSDDWIVLDEKEGSNFVGFDQQETNSRLLRYRKTKMQGKEFYQLVLNNTPFYAESGGQVGDTGLLFFGEEKIPVTDTKKENDLIIHFTEKLPADATQPVKAKIDQEKRISTAIHHSATHLLHAALRSVLGEHVQQKGSLVNNEYLRFDFSHFAKLTKAEIRKIELLVNEKIRKNIPVVVEETNKEEALKKGAMALFGEKYGDKVRMVTMDPAYSIELCGGTHVHSTGELGFFKIINETAVGAGLRRMEALSGQAAENFMREQLTELEDVREKLKNPKNLVGSIDNLLLENTGLKKELEKAREKQLSLLKDELLRKKRDVKNINFIGEIVDVANEEGLKKLAFLLKNELNHFVIVLLADITGKASAVVMIDENIVSAKNIKAPKIVKEIIAPFIQGGGGGQPTLATAGGKNVSQFNDVIESVQSFLSGI